MQNDGPFVYQLCASTARNKDIRPGDKAILNGVPGTHWAVVYTKRRPVVTWSICFILDFLKCIERRRGLAGKHL